MLQKVKAGEFDDARRISELLRNHDLPNFVGAGGDKARAAVIARSLSTGLEAALHAMDAHQSASLITSAIGEWEKPVKGLPLSEHTCRNIARSANSRRNFGRSLKTECSHGLRALGQNEVSFEGGAYLLDCKNPVITLANIRRRILAGEGRPSVTEFDMQSDV